MLNLGLTIQFSEMFNECETAGNIEQLEREVTDMIEGIARWKKD